MKFISTSDRPGPHTYSLGPTHKAATITPARPAPGGPAILDTCRRLVREKSQIVNVVAFDHLVRMEKARGLVSALVALNLPACPSPMKWSPANKMSKRRHAMGNSRWVASSTTIADRRMPVMIAPQAFRKSLLALVLSLLDDVNVDASPLTALFCASVSCEVRLRSKKPRRWI